MAHRRDPARAQSARRQDAASRRVLRDHAARDPGSRRQPAQAVAGPGQRAAGAARARLPGRLQSVAGVVAQGAARPVRRPRAVAGAAHDRRARGRDRGVQGARVLVDRSRLRASGPALQRAPAEIARQEIRAVRSDQRARCARRARRADEIRAGPPRRQRRAVEGTQAPAVAAVHDLDLAAGGRAQARLLDQPHDAPRPGPVRGRADRRRGHRRPDHLHAYRFAEHRRRCDHRIAQGDCARLRRQGAAREPNFYRTKSKNAQEAHEAIRPTSALHTPASVAAISQRRPAQALRPDLETRRRLPDAVRDVEYRFGRSDAGGPIRRSAPAARRSSIRASSPSTRKAATRRTPRTTTRAASCRR